MESPTGKGAMAFSAQCSPTFWTPQAVAGDQVAAVLATQPGVMELDCSAALYLLRRSVRSRALQLSSGPLTSEQAERTTECDQLGDRGRALARVTGRRAHKM